MKMLLEEIVGMALCKSRELKNCFVTGEESVGGNCKNGYVKSRG